MPHTAGEANSAEQYRQKWDHMFQERAHFEWHCDFDMVSSLLHPYFEKALNASESAGRDPLNVLLDVGCGSSSLCVDFFKHFAGCTDPSKEHNKRFDKLLLTDVSPYILDVLQHRYKDDPVMKDCTSFHVADCRHLNEVGISAESLCVVLEKGTIDAMDGEDDKAAILHECLRVVRPGGVVVSISFPAVARLQMLEEELRRWNEREGAQAMQLHMHVVGSGDPARGGKVVFVAVLGGEQVMEGVGYAPSALTTTVLERAKKSGSIIQEAEEVLEEQVDVFGDV